MPLPSKNKAVQYTDSIGSIYITGAGYVMREFKGVSPNSAFGWQELVWKKPPNRGSNFKFTNMDQIDVGLVARCEIEIAFMTPDDYKDMRKILKQKHYMIKFYDMDEQQWVTRDMYCTENTKSKFLILSKAIQGTIDCKFSFVGTNLDLDETIDSDGNEITVQRMYKINYIINNEIDESKSFTTGYGSQITIQPSIEAEEGTYFAYWVSKNDDDEITGYYLPNQSITVWDNMSFYPYFKQSSTN